jgi:DNA-binding beta-propeller fold protein YncE
MSHRGVLVIVEKSDHAVAFYDLQQNCALGRVVLENFPHEMVVDGARGVAYVGQYGVRTAADPGEGGATVFAIDIARRKLLRTLDCRPFRRIHGLALDQQGRLYALSEAAAVLLVFDDPLRENLPSRAAVTGGLKSHLVAVTGDGERAYSMNLLTHTVTKFAPHCSVVGPSSLMPGIHPEGNCFSADGKSLLVTNRGSSTIARIDSIAFVVRDVAPVRADPTRIYAVGSDRLLVTHFNSRSISILDAGSLSEIAHISCEGKPAAACIHPHQPIAYVSLDSNESVEVDVENGKILNSRRTGTEPDACFVMFD